jgi:hypothetical protein
MLRKLASVAILALVVMMLVGCAAHTHIVGTGPAGSDVVVKRQWYAIWGLVPINQVDSGAMAAGATNYSIHTEASFLDVIINIFTQYVTITSRTVTVTK